ncbi:hypothetical protein PNOK_0819700 [Pyrrhoderma noxium]|uniref:Uncharacterized protein n=1 Tax=Pyrrhoderma noxium TaxID=2282107 RepID=A0A286UAI4_9AGAM|nr:hypothetical protein PNOK_0819700 [Pyrrhoderma noxium]
MRALEAVLLEAAGIANCVVKAIVNALGWVDTRGFKGHTLMGAGSVSKLMLRGGVLLSTHKALLTQCTLVLQVSQNSAMHALFENRVDRAA